MKHNYDIGVVFSLVVLSSFGLAALLGSRPEKIRIAAVLVACLIVVVEFYAPREGEVLEREKTEYIEWLRTNPAEPIKILDLPQFEFHRHYYLFTQSLTGFPTAYGFQHRLRPLIETYLERNPLLHSWYINRSPHCLPHNEPSFTAALEQLLADGFSHIVVHNWLYGDQFIMHTFKGIPAAYDNGYVSIYRLRDLSLSCQNQVAELPRFIHFAQSSSAIPGLETAILSFHPSEAIDPALFRYLGSLFSDWASLLHLYQNKGELITQIEGKRYDDLAAFMNDNQVIHFLYNTKDTDPNSLADQAALAGFNLCQRETHDNGSIIELQVSQAFSCELVASDKPFQIRYDNGIRLEHLLSDSDQDALDLQLWWSSLPDEAHAVSIQVFDVNGAKALGRDFVIGHAPLARHRIDISSLAPGDYAVKLIVYNFESGTSIAGTVSVDSRRIDRAIEVATIQRN